MMTEIPFDVAAHPLVQTTIECGDCITKMRLFKGTNCLMCLICKELRWLV